MVSLKRRFLEIAITEIGTTRPGESATFLAWRAGGRCACSIGSCLGVCGVPAPAPVRLGTVVDLAGPV